MAKVSSKLFNKESLCLDERREDAIVIDLAIVVLKLGTREI